MHHPQKKEEEIEDSREREGSWLFLCTEPGKVWRCALSLPCFGTSFVPMQQSVSPGQGEVPPAAGDIQSMLLSAVLTMNVVAKKWGQGEGGGVAWGDFCIFDEKKEMLTICMHIGTPYGELITRLYSPCSEPQTWGWFCMMDVNSLQMSICPVLAIGILCYSQHGSTLMDCKHYHF